VGIARIPPPDLACVVNEPPDVCRSLWAVFQALDIADHPKASADDGEELHFVVGKWVDHDGL